ncbi:MAG: S8 family serine peptidase [Psychroflexus sp.]
MKVLLLLLISLCSVVVYSQQNLKTLVEETEEYIQGQKQRIKDYKSSNPKALEEDNNNQMLRDVLNGHPVYIEDLNQKAEKALRTEYLKASGYLGYELKGNGYNIGIWEVGGIPELMHSEFEDNNANSRIIKKDESEEETFHATHVAGTLIAKGVDSDAEGMAVEAILHAYDADNDLTEVINALENNELIISNHSYGYPVANLEDNEWFMGAYTAEAYNWDNIINFFPYYTPVFAAGNDGTQDYEGGFLNGYDKLTGSINSKNTLSVANASMIQLERRTGVYESADINTGSSQGPTDDGRIKPDITGLGTGIRSSALGNGYRNATGTSMASPNVAGSALLLQELHQNLTNQFMLSSTLKGLISVTADDAGLEGPDPIFGWGVMNSKRAAEAIINQGDGDIIREITLVENEKQTFRVENNSGITMKVAIAWNDPAGTFVEDAFNDPTPVLVNDLDVRVRNLANQQEYFPWRLDMDNPAGAAKKGDNIVDNIEIIEIEEQGVFDINISHKDDLQVRNDERKQVYSLIILNGIEQTLSDIGFDSQTISFWPNPVKNKLNITSSEFDLTKNTRISIYDMVGRKVIDKKDFSSTSNLSIDTSTLSKGIYILKLTDGAQSIQKRIIKE